MGHKPAQTSKVTIRRSNPALIAACRKLSPGSNVHRFFNRSDAELQEWLDYPWLTGLRTVSQPTENPRFMPEDDLGCDVTYDITHSA